MAAPAWMHPDDPALADGARARIKKLPKARVVSSSGPPEDNKGISLEVAHDIMDGNVFVDFKDTRARNDDDNRDRDLYRWAVLYENQRGLTLFSTAYYSSRSLLPHDPRPFTVPDPGPSSPSEHPHRAPPNVTLTTYPLPDPTWRWVSKTWLVDMRGDGDVQHDGFEYNWFFRRAHWRAHVGWLSAGGFVRRRRWIRLMMRPSDARRQAEALFDDRARADAERPVMTEPESKPKVWRGDEDDWSRVHAALRAYMRDGPKLELWAEWLADLGGVFVRNDPRTWSEDNEDMKGDPEAVKLEEKLEEKQGAGGSNTPEMHEHPLREWVLAVLRSHAMDIRGLFIYPDSRAQLGDMFLRAGLEQDIFIGAPNPSQRHFLGPMDFWSRKNELDLPAADSGHEKSPV